MSWRDKAIPDNPQQSGSGQSWRNKAVPDKAPVRDDWDARAAEQQPGFFSNAMRATGDRLSDLTGNLVQGVGTVVREGNQAFEDLTGLEVRRPALPFLPDELASADTATDIGQQIEDQDFGYQPNFTVDRALEDPSLGNIAGAIGEQGPAALADMIGLGINPVAYFLSRNQEISEARAGRNNRENAQPTGSEFMAALPATAASTALDRLSLGKILGQGDNIAIEGFRDVLGATGRSAYTEGATEGIQEGIEYAGETLGTERGGTWEEGTKRVVGGTMIGAPVGGAVGGGRAWLDMTPAEIEAEAERLGMTPEEVVELYEEGMGQNDIGQVIEETTGTNTPPPVQDPQSRRAREQELSDALSGTDVLRRDDIEEFDADGNPVYREGAQPAQDPRGRQANPDTFGTQREADRVARELGVTLPGDRLDLAARDIANGVDPVEAVRSYAPEVTGSDFRRAEARRQRRDEAITGGFNQGRDYQPAGRERPQGRGETILLLDAKYDRQGKLVAGEQVESTGEIQQDDKGRQFLNVRYGDGREDTVPLNRITVESTPDNPRMEQDFEDRASTLPTGVGTTNPGPETKTDSISSAMVRDTSPKEVEPDRVFAPEDGPEPGPQPREGQTYDNETDVAGALGAPRTPRYNEVNRPPQSPGLGDALTDQNPLRDVQADGNQLPGPSGTGPARPGNFQNADGDPRRGDSVPAGGLPTPPQADQGGQDTGEVTGEVEDNDGQARRQRVEEIANRWENELGDAGMATAIRSGLKARPTPDQDTVDFQQKKLDEALAKQQGTAAPERDNWSVAGVAAQSDREKKDFADSKQNPELAELYAEAEAVGEAVIQQINDAGYSMSRKWEMPPEMKKLADTLTGLTGTVSRASKQGVAILRGYKRAQPDQLKATVKRGRETINQLRDGLNPQQQQETTNAPEETAAPETEVEAPKPPRPAGPRSKQVDPDNDSLLDAIGRSGGMSFEDGRRMGLGEADMKDANRQRPGRQPFRKTTDRSSADTAEAMTELGYLQGDRDTRDLADQIDNEFRGDKVWSTMGDAAERQATFDEWQMEQDRQQAEADEREASQNMADEDPDFDPFDPDQNPDAFSEDDGFGLEEQTEAGLAEQAVETAQREADEAKARRDEQQRAEADEQVNDFTLTGSDRPVDQAEARGQENMFDHPYDDESIPDDKKTDLGGTTFLSGVPTLDMIKRLFGPLFVGSKEEMDAWATRAKDMSADLRDSWKATAGHGTKVARRFYNWMVGDLDRMTRALADKYNSDTMKKVADAFHHTAGGKSDGFTQQTLSVRRNTALNKFASRFAKISKKLAAGKLSRRDRDAQSQIYRMLENPKLPRKGRVGEAVKEIEQLFKDLRDYQVERGIEVGYVEGYVPRWLDRNQVGKNKTGFINKATEAYMSMGSDRETARAQAAALYDSVIEGDTNTLGQNKAGTVAGVDSTKPRKLTKEAAKKLDAFWERDIDRAISNYLNAAVRRGEVADTEINGIKLGDNAENWPEIRAKIQEEDPSVTADDLAALEDDVAYHTGLAQSSDTGKARQASAWIRTIGAMAMLDRVAISALPELVMGPVRGTTGNPIQDLNSYAKNAQMVFSATARKLARTISGGAVGKDQALQDAYDLAEYLGATAGDAISYSMQARMMGEEPGNRALTQVADKYYRNVGLTQLNDFSRVMAMRHANRFMTYLARDHARNGRSKNRTEVSLRDLGIPRGKEAEFAKWFGKNFADKAPTAARLEALKQKGGRDKEMANAYDRAVHTFVDQAVQRPDSSTRPKWADTPLGSMIFQLLNFTWAFQKNVINRAARTVGNNELDVVDRALMGSGFMVGGAALTAMAALGNTLREEMDEALAENLDGRPPTPETPWRKAEKAVSYSGLTGRVDPLIQLFAGTRYQRSVIETMAGPTLGTMGDAIDKQLGLITQNSENTNTAERSSMKSIHQIMVTPALQAALTGLPLAGPLGRALVMGGAIGGARATREPFIEATAGEEDRALEWRRLNDPLTGITEPESSGGGSGRAAGRGGNRSSGRSAGRESGR